MKKLALIFVVLLAIASPSLACDPPAPPVASFGVQYSYSYSAPMLAPAPCAQMQFAQSYAPAYGYAPVPLRGFAPAYGLGVPVRGFVAPRRFFAPRVVFDGFGRAIVIQ